MGSATTPTATTPAYGVASRPGIELVLRPAPDRVRASVSRLVEVLTALPGTTGRAIGSHPDLAIFGAARPDLRWQRGAALLDPVDPLFDELVGNAMTRYDARRHTAAALLWKQYDYWTVFPVALGWLLGRRVPLTRIENAYVALSADAPNLLTAAGRLQVGALAGDVDPAGASVLTATEDGLIEAIRTEVVEGHLAPAIDVFAERTKVSSRVLWGSVAEAVVQPIITYGPTLTGRAPADLRADALSLLAGLGRSLVELVELTEPTAASPAGTVQRRTCCLAFTCGLALCHSCCVQR